MRLINNSKRLLFVFLSIFFVFSCVSAQDRDWQNAIEVDSIEAYAQFLVEHPNVHQSQEAKRRLIYIQTKDDWEKTVAVDTIDSYNAFLSKYKNSIYNDSANKRLEELNWQKTSDADSK